jgi:hypothetical protein
MPFLLRLRPVDYRRLPQKGRSQQSIVAIKKGRIAPDALHFLPFWEDDRSNQPALGIAKGAYV